MTIKSTLKSKWKMLSMLLLLITSVGCVGWYLKTLTPPPPPCPIKTLMLDESVIPEQLNSVSYSDEPADRFGIQFRSVSFFSSQDYHLGKIDQTVYREWTEREAKRGYEDLVDTYFDPRARFFCRDKKTQWLVPQELTYRSEFADQFQLGCTVDCSTNPPRCQYIARYGIYVVWYHARLSEVITYTEFERILQDIDSRMTQCLEQIENEATVTQTAPAP